jgi:hypothetical protein
MEKRSAFIIVLLPRVSARTAYDQGSASECKFESYMLALPRHKKLAARLPLSAEDRHAADITGTTILTRMRHWTTGHQENYLDFCDHCSHAIGMAKIWMAH